MNRNDERAPRIGRRRPDSVENTDPYQDPFAYSDQYTIPEVRRRRSQAARMAESVGYYAVPANEQGGTGQPVAARRGGGPRSETQSDTDEWTREYSRSGRSDPYGEEPRDRDAFGQAGAKQATRKYPNGRSKRPQTREKPDQYNYGDEDDYNDFLEDSREPKPRRRIARWIVSILILVALLAGVTYVGKNRPDLVQSAVMSVQTLLYGPTPSPLPPPDPTPEPTPDASATAVVGFTSSVSEQPGLEDPIIFEVITSVDTDRVRLVDSSGQTLIERVGSGYYTDTDEGRLWKLMHYFEESYSGYVEAYPGNESGWNEARGSRLTIDIGGEDAAGDQGEEADPVSPLAFALVDAAPLASLDVNETIRRGNETVTEFARETSILVGDADMYRFYTTQAGELQEGMKGVHTFRGDNTRGNASSGVVPSVPTKLETEWSANAGGPIDSETAFGAQPLLVRWHQQFRAKMEPVLPEKREQKSLTEVVFAANDGNIYFFDAEDGTKTREPMQVDEPMLGTPALYPRGIPIMFIGSGVYGGDNSASMRSFNLLTGKNSGNLIGDNEFATSKDHTFITSPLVLNDADTMLAAGGNGIFYALTLNSEVNPADFSYAIQATAVLLATDSDGADDAALSTLAAYGEHAYVATVGGVLKSIDMNTMTVDWAKDLGGATYAALAINVRGEGDPLLYAVSVTETGASIIRCINAKTGDPVWEVKGGSAVKASPLVGEGSLKGTVYFTAPDRIMALDGLTGALQWETPLEGAVATSPIAVYDGEETGVVIQGDAAGLHVIDGGTGEIRYSLPLDGAVVGSPAAFDDLIVVITESGMLHGVRAK